jgi:hypothetical protein
MGPRTDLRKRSKGQLDGSSLASKYDSEAAAFFALLDNK